MKVLANLGKVSDGRDALVIQKGKSIEYVICHNYDPNEPEGSQWSGGTYFSTLAGFAHAVSEIEYANRKHNNKILDNYMVDKIKPHVGHNLECVYYGDLNDPSDYCIEDVDTGEVIISAEDYE